MGKQRDKTAVLNEVNQEILVIARESESTEPEWGFYCECGREGCHEFVSLTLDDYAELHDRGEAVLAEGHELSQVERARRLQDESDALKRQAAHQIRRAQRNLGPPVR